VRYNRDQETKKKKRRDVREGSGETGDGRRGGGKGERGGEEREREEIGKD
jgi:hypothetical protein